MDNELKQLCELLRQMITQMEKMSERKKKNKYLECAKELFELKQGFVEAGFTDEQAMRLVVS